jgi:hypothetical protein
MNVTEQVETKVITWVRETEVEMDSPAVEVIPTTTQGANLTHVGVPTLTNKINFQVAVRDPTLSMNPNAGDAVN